MLVRVATREDIPAITEMVRRVVPLMQESGNFQWDSEYPNSAVFERDVELGQLWVATIVGQIAGIAAITTEQQPEYASVGWDVTEAAIVVHRLAVDPLFRGQGAATALMRQAEVVARQRAIAVLRVDTNRNNGATRKLFPKLGYVLAGETGFSFRPGLRFCCYEKRI